MHDTIAGCCRYWLAVIYHHVLFQNNLGFSIRTKPFRQVNMQAGLEHHTSLFASISKSLCRNCKEFSVNNGKCLVFFKRQVLVFLRNLVGRYYSSVTEFNILGKVKQRPCCDFNLLSMSKYLARFCFNIDIKDVLIQFILMIQGFVHLNVPSNAQTCFQRVSTIKNCGT